MTTPEDIAAAETAVAETEWHNMKELTDRVISLQNELETLRKDKAMLDWMERYRPCLSNSKPFGDCPGGPHVCHGPSSLESSHFYGATYREAIDAAMASKPGE